MALYLRISGNESVGSALMCYYDKGSHGIAKKLNIHCQVVKPFEDSCPRKKSRLFGCQAKNYSVLFPSEKLYGNATKSSPFSTLFITADKK